MVIAKQKVTGTGAFSPRVVRKLGGAALARAKSLAKIATISHHQVKSRNQRCYQRNRERSKGEGEKSEGMEIGQRTPVERSCNAERMLG